MLELKQPNSGRRRKTTLRSEAGTGFGAHAMSAGLCLVPSGDSAALPQAWMRVVGEAASKLRQGLRNQIAPVTNSCRKAASPAPHATGTTFPHCKEGKVWGSAQWLLHALGPRSHPGAAREPGLRAPLLRAVTPAASRRPTGPPSPCQHRRPPAPPPPRPHPLTSRRREAPQPRRNSRMLLRHSLSLRGSG